MYFLYGDKLIQKTHIISEIFELIDILECVQ